MSHVLDAYTEPDVPLARKVGQVLAHERLHTFGAFGQNLVDMPIGDPHHVEDDFDIVDGDILLKEVAHGVDKDLSWSSPFERIQQSLWH